VPRKKKLPGLWEALLLQEEIIDLAEATILWSLYLYSVEGAVCKDIFFLEN
jgi:hypothetical protein